MLSTSTIDGARSLNAVSSKRAYSPSVVSLSGSRSRAESPSAKFVAPRTVSASSPTSSTGPIEVSKEAEREFMDAMQAYKEASGRMFPTWSEVLEVLKNLGYQKSA
jgi:hypothetical protein